MNFEINIARDGTHLFATAERSLTDSDKCKAVYDELKKSFPDCKLTVTASVNIGYGVDMDNIEQSVNDIWARINNNDKKTETKTANNMYTEITSMMWLRLTSKGIPNATKTNRTELAIITDYLIDDVVVRVIYNRVEQVEQYYIRDINL